MDPKEILLTRAWLIGNSYKEELSEKYCIELEKNKNKNQSLQRRKKSAILVDWFPHPYFGCSKETSHPDSSFEYPQHMFWLRNKKNNFQLHTLIWGPGVYH